MASRNNTSNRIERLQVETTVGQYFFQDLYNREVYFEDFDDKSSNYFRLDYDLSFTFTGGRNFIGLRGTADTMLVNSEILVEVVDSNGQLLKSQVYGLGDELDTKVISVDVASNTPPGDTIVTLIGVASQAPDGTPIPPAYRGVPNFRWTRIFTCKPGTSNKSPVLYSETSRPAIKIEEILKPFYHLTHNQELSGSTNTGYWTGNPTSSYILSSDGYAAEIEGANTTTKISYRKSGDKFFVTAKPQGTNFIDFGGFTKDMEGGIIIVRDPQVPRPGSFLGYTSHHDPNTNPVFAPEEEGDGLLEDISYLHPTSTVVTRSFVTGAYVTMVEEVISPFEIRTSSPHTTIQGNTSATYQSFEHFEFSDSNFELMWSQAPTSYSMQTSSANGGPLNTSYAQVTFNNLEPLTGDVTRVKCYMKNEQAPFDWVMASDNAVFAQELLYRKDHEKHRSPIGDFSVQGIAHNGATSLKTYWTSSGVGTNTPSIGIYKQQTSAENPPVQDCVIIGDNQQALNLDDTAYWLFEPSGSNTASFYENQWYELSFKSVSQKTQIPSWTPTFNNAIEEPKISVYMSGSAFTDGGDDFGKFIGLIEDVAVKKKQVDYDYNNNEREIGKKFIFKADGTEGGKPKFKIDSGVWYLWDISIKPWERKGFTPGTWDVIFPTVKCNVAAYDSLDFKFEFYNDYGDIANYTAVVPHVPWKNELTATFTNIVTNTVTATGPATFSGGLSASGPNYFTSTSFSGPTTFSSTVNFNGPATFSGGMSSSGPNVFGGNTTISGPVSLSGPITAGGPITMSGPGLFGQDCNDSWIISGSVYLPCLPAASQSRIVTWNEVTGELKTTSSFGLNNAGTPDQDLFKTFAITHSGVTPHAAQASQDADNSTDTFTFVGGANVTLSSAADQMTIGVGNICKTSYGTFGVDGGVTNTATACNQAMKILGAGGITTSLDVTGEINISMSAAYLNTYISNVSSQNIFATVATTHSGVTVHAAQNNLVANSTTDQIVFIGGANVTLSSNATNDSITISTATSAGGSSGDNLGNHTATASLQMGEFWITQSDGYGHFWKGTSTDFATVERTALDVFKIRNLGTKDNVLEISDGAEGFSFIPNALTHFTQSLLTTHGGIQIKANNDLFYYSLKEADAFHTMKYNIVTGEISYIRENSSGGGGSHCMTSGDLVKGTAGHVGFNPYHGAQGSNALKSFSYIPCTTTIGPPLFNPTTPTGIGTNWNSYAGVNDETAWLLVNGFNSMDCPPGSAGLIDSDFEAERGMVYAAIFNKMADPNKLGSDGFDCAQAGAGHGVKIGVSSIPRNAPIKGGFPGQHTGNVNTPPALNCTIAGDAAYYQVNQPFNQTLQTSHTDCGLANVFYLSCFHKEWGLGPYKLTDHYAGGIRKDHNNYKNAIKIDTVSDRRLKQDITDTVLTLDHLMGIRVRDFEWKETPMSKGGMRVSGFIAQEVAEVFPDAVTGNEEVNDEPKSNPMVMDYLTMVPLLVKSVQDQQKMIDDLKERIAILEKR